METTSPFKALQNLQEEQREGWMPASDAPETDAAAHEKPTPGFAVASYDFARKLERERDSALELLREIRDNEVNPQDEADKFLRDGVCSELSKCRQALSGRTVSCSQCNEAAKKLDEKDAAIAELNQRLTEQRESFMSQLVRIEDGWREKLREARKDANRLAEALDPIAWMHSMPENGKAFNEAEEAMMAHEALARQ